MALKDVITWHQVPIQNDDDELEIKSWPLMLPHNMALAPVLYPMLCHLLFANFSCSFKHHQVDAIMRSGHREILGHADEIYWEKLHHHHGFPKPPAGSDFLGFNLYGDEGQIFDHVEHLCLNWASELSPFWKNSRYSRFLIGMVPSRMFWKTDAKINATLNEILRIIIRSFQILEEGHAGLQGRLVAFKGDWKFLVQSLNLCPQPSRDHICWACGATKSMVCPFTDMSAGAQWRHMPPVHPVHQIEPALAQLSKLPIIALDAMHMFHLGVGRDLAASVLVMLLRTQAPRQGNLNLFFLFIHSLPAPIAGRRSNEGCNCQYQNLGKSELERQSFAQMVEIEQIQIVHEDRQVRSLDWESLAHRGGYSILASSFQLTGFAPNRR